MLKQAKFARNDMVEYATLDLRAADLESHGLDLEDGWIDGLGPTRGAQVVVPSGAELVLIAFTHAPEDGIVVWAPLAVDGPAVAEELADELGVPRERITWRREEGIDWPQLG